MEYQKKKKQILSNVEYTSLLTLNLVQNKLQRNFKSIVQALLLAQSQGTQLKEDLQLLANKNQRQISTLYNKLGDLQKKIKEMSEKQLTKNGLDKEELDFESKSLKHLSEPKVNINLVQSIQNTATVIPSAKIVDNHKNQYEQLKQKVDRLLAEQIIPADLDKKLNSMKDNINLLKAQLKILSNKEPKSTRRISGTQKIQTLAPNQTQSKSLIDGIQQQFQKEMNNVHISLNSMKLALEQMQEVQGQLKRNDNKSHVRMEQLGKNQKRLDQDLKNANNDFKSKIEGINTEISNIKIKLQSNNQQTIGKSKKEINLKQNVSPKNQISDKLQTLIKGLVTQSEFKKFKNQIKDKISSLEGSDQIIRKQLKQQVQMLTEILDAKEQQIGNIQKAIDELKRKIDDVSSCCQRKNNIAISRHDQLKKNLQNLREDLEFYKSMNQLTYQAKTVNQSNGQTDQKQKTDGANGNKGTQDLKKYLNRKLHDQRTYLLGLIRDLQKKSGGKTSYQQDIVNVWDKLAEINLFLNKKANEDDIKKSLAFFQKKLSNIYQRITSSDQSNQDARIAKTNWFCLSCDKNLHNYQGKVGQHVVWDSLPIKPGYTKYYSKEEKKSLPTLKR